MTSKNKDSSNKENDVLLVNKLRACSLCGLCESSSFLAWPQGGSDGIEEDALPKGVFKNRDLKAWYMVRCGYFKFTVSNPEALKVCEAFKELE